MSKESILLSEKERVNIMSAWCGRCDLRAATSNYLVTMQVRHALEYLLRYKCGDKEDAAHGWIMISPEEYQKLLKECE